MIDSTAKLTKLINLAKKNIMNDFIIDILVIVWAFLMSVILSSYLCY